MSQSKHEEKPLFFSPDQICYARHHMNITKDYAKEEGNYLFIKDTFNLVSTCRRNFMFYQPVLDIKKGFTYIVEGKVKSLIELIKKDPSLLFEKHPVIRGPRGQIYFDCSQLQVIKFLCDDDMDAQIKSLIPERFNAIRQEQYAEVDCGGGDLIKIARDPREIISEKGFAGLTHYKKTYTLYDHTHHEVSFPLLENPDGIFCYPDEQGKKHFCYVNKVTQTIDSLDDHIIPEENESAFEQFKDSFDAMENNSSRRSSEQEHQLITSVLKCTLVRKGIFYKDNDVLYRDSRTPFNLVNAYRKCIRLYEAAGNNTREADTYFREGVGKCQGEEMWLLQRLCEAARPFHPLDKTRQVFNRGHSFYNSNTNTYKSAFDKGIIQCSVIYKGGNWKALEPFGAGGALGSPYTHIAADLIALCWFIEKAKAKVIELKLEQEERMNCESPAF